MSKFRNHSEATTKAIRLFAETIDYAINAVHYSIDAILMVLITRFDKKFENRDEKFLEKYDGEKLVKKLMSLYLTEFPYPDYKINENSKEYILGEYLGELAVYSKIPFRDILIRINLQDTIKFLEDNNYDVDQELFEKWVNKIYKKDDYVTRLKIFRDKANLSQAQLAEKSGVNIRNIQMYEQRNNDINAASGVILQKLAKALHVKVDELLESE